jgi:error-prone DNA polymerase
MKIVSCGDLPNQRDGRNLEVAGIVLVRQRPGSAKGVLFVTIEDETGVANAILWPDKFETYRRQIMSASMIAVRGRCRRRARSSMSSPIGSPTSTPCCARSGGRI